jgi:ATP-dependent DNA ligase
LRKAGPALIFSEHMDGEDGESMFRHACALGLEGIISKRQLTPLGPSPLAERGFPVVE